MKILVIILSIYIGAICKEPKKKTDCSEFSKIKFALSSEKKAEIKAQIQPKIKLSLVSKVTDEEKNRTKYLIKIYNKSDFSLFQMIVLIKYIDKSGKIIDFEKSQLNSVIGSKTTKEVIIQKKNGKRKAANKIKIELMEFNFVEK